MRINKKIKMSSNKKPKDIETEELDDNDLYIQSIQKNPELNNSNFDEKADMEGSKILDFNVIMLGDSNVGKTSILKKFIDNSFSDQSACTVNVEFKTKNLKIDNNLYARLALYDTAGQEKFRSLTRQYYNRAHGIVLVYDLTNEISFNKLNSWVKEINDNAGNVEAILVGNKSDLNDRKISKLKAKNYAKDKNFKYIEVSAKEGTNILLLFEELSIGMNKRRNEESTSNVEMGSIDNYVFRREEINKKLKRKKEAKCC